MQKDSKNNTPNPNGVDDSVSPLGDDSVESLTIQPSPDLKKVYGVDDSGDIRDNDAALNLNKDESLSSQNESYDESFDQEDVDSLSEVRVANMNDDLDVIETDFGGMEPDEPDEFDEDGELVPVTSSKQLSDDQHLASILRNNASLTLSNKASRRTIVFLLACIGIGLILLSILIYAFTLYPKTVYIPTKDNAAICEVMPEDNPYLTDLSISEFGRDGILSLYSINFTNWQEQTDRVFDEYFTSDGKIRTIEALKQSGLIAYVDNNALSLRANSTQTSHVESKGFFPNGSPFWTVTFPFVVEVYSGREKEPIQVRQYVATARVVVDRASAMNPKGLGIDAVTLFESKQ